MTKAELISRIVDAMVDPWTDDPEDYLDAQPIYDTEEAKDMLTDLHAYDIDLEPEDILPDEVTPELVMEAYNCLIRARKHEARITRLAEWITDNNCVCEYVNYYGNTDIVPTDLLWESFPFDIGDRTPNPLFLIDLAKRSRNFNSAEEFCFFDKAKDQLVSTNNPFSDGYLDAEAFARFAIDDAETLGYFLDCLMDDEEIADVFGCTKEELIHG